MKSLQINYSLPPIDFEVGKLTPREMEVLRLSHCSAKEIADILKIKVSTLNTHFSNIKNKTGLLDFGQRSFFSGYMTAIEQSNEIIN